MLSLPALVSRLAKEDSEARRKKKDARRHGEGQSGEAIRLCRSNILDCFGLLAKKME
jgi:hypothetical protein